MRGLAIHVAKFGQMYWPDYSRQGFLGDDERLIDVLVEDNNFVRDHELTHRDLARCLYTMRKISDDLGGGGKPFSYRNCLYRVYGNFCKNGFQGSPFGDPVVVRAGGIEVENLTTGQRLTFHRLLPHLICWYGFYEGKTEFRVEPRDIIEMFGLKK